MRLGIDPQGNAGADISSGITPDGVEATAQADAVVTEPGKAGESANSAQCRHDSELGRWIAARTSVGRSSPTIPLNGGSTAPRLFALRDVQAGADDSVYGSGDTDKGTFSFAIDKYAVTEDNQIVLGNTGTATFTVNRIGGSDGAATVNWAVTDGTGTVWHRSRRGYVGFAQLRGRRVVRDIYRNHQRRHRAGTK